MFRLDSWLRGHPLLVDAGMTFVLVAGWGLFGVVLREDGAYFLLSLGLLLPLAVRRRWPVHCATAVVTVAFVQWLAVRDSNGALPADLAVPVAVHAVAAYGPVWASRGGLAAGLSGAVLGGLSWPQLPVPVAAHLLTGAFLASTVVAAWTVGTLRRVRANQLATLAERARLLEVEREQRDRLAVLAERTRIAREMHDVLAHSLAVLIAQADGGRYAAATSATAGTAALATIGTHARQALAETRRVLGVLRDGPETGPPQPGLDDVPELVDRVRAGGLDVTLTLDEPVEPGLGLVVYRVVQEGLTNVLKHANATRAEVSVHRRGQELEISVRDDGDGPAERRGYGPSGMPEQVNAHNDGHPTDSHDHRHPGMRDQVNAHNDGDPTDSHGYGLLGMRERVGAYGGTVTVAPGPGGGTVLTARIPT